MIRQTSSRSAFLASIIIRGLYILDSIKNYTLIILDISYFYYLMSSLLANTVYILKNVLIGYQMTAINDLMNHKKNWKEFGFMEKFFFVMVIILIGFTFLTTAAFSLWARNQMKGNLLIIESEERKRLRSQTSIEMEEQNINNITIENK